MSQRIADTNLHGEMLKMEEQFSILFYKILVAYADLLTGFDVDEKGKSLHNKWFDITLPCGSSASDLNARGTPMNCIADSISWVLDSAGHSELAASFQDEDKVMINMGEINGILRAASAALGKGKWSALPPKKWSPPVPHHDNALAYGRVLMEHVRAHREGLFVVQVSGQLPPIHTMHCMHSIMNMCSRE